MTFTPGIPPSAIWSLMLDAALIQDADYEFDTDDRSYIDSQTRGIQSLILQSLLLGVHATWVTLDTNSVAVQPGNVVCLTGNVAGTVTLATSAALTNAGQAVGVCLLAGSPGALILVALEGIVLQGIVGLSGSGLYAKINTSNSTVQRTSSIGSSDYPMGWVDTYGNLMLHPQLPISGSGGGSGVLTVVNVNATGTGGAQPSPYTATPGQTVVVNTSVGAVVVNFPTLTTGQTVGVSHDPASTISGSDTVTINPPPGGHLQEAPPNLGSFASSIVWNSSSFNGSGLAWYNGGSAGGYLIQP